MVKAILIILYAGTRLSNLIPLNKAFPIEECVFQYRSLRLLICHNNNNHNRRKIRKGKEEKRKGQKIISSIQFVKADFIISHNFSSFFSGVGRGYRIFQI